MGVCTLPQCADVAALRGDFDVERLLPAEVFPATEHAQLEVFVVNPIFAPRSGRLLADALQLVRRRCLHYMPAPGEPLLEVLPFMAQVGA